MTELSDLGQGDRRCVCCREISKLHEEIWRGTIQEAAAWLSRGDEDRVRGEFTIVLGPWTPKGLAKEDIKKRIISFLEKMESDGLSRSDAVSIVCDKNSGILESEWGVRKSEVYKIALHMNWNVKRKEM